MLFFVRALIIALVALVVLGSRISAYPGAVNLIPCTDFLGAGNARIAYEADGSDQPYANGYTTAVYTQFSLGDNVEFGLDFNDVSGANTALFNAKYLLSEGSVKAPKIAVGVWNVGEESEAAWYAVGCKTHKKARYHFGAQVQHGSSWLMLGTDYQLNPTISLLADWQTGDGHWHTLGAYWQSTPRIGVTLYWVRNNTSALRPTDDYVGLNVQYNFRMM